MPYKCNTSDQQDMNTFKTFTFGKKVSFLFVLCCLFSMFGLVYKHKFKFGLTFKPNKIELAILIPTTTRGIKSPQLNELSLMIYCLPSIAETMESAYNYVVYLGIDKNDTLCTMLDDIVRQYPSVKPVIVDGGSFTKVVNKIARVAYKDNMEYFVRINDDTKIETKNWTSLGIQTLLNYRPPNVGVVGPTCNQGNTHILTHDMVHRTHLNIFTYYYHPAFDNWWSDDWITDVYKPGRSIKLKQWSVRHIRTHGKRYVVAFTTHRFLQNATKDCKEILNKYLCSLGHNSPFQNYG